MKFITKKWAPNIPLELLEAQESDELIFFCGAGISYPAGLPGFVGLVNHIYDELLETKHNLEIEAIKNGFYDRALGLLEHRIQAHNESGINSVRRIIIDKLRIQSGANLETHQSILELAKTKEHKYRLVTTNVDRGFDTAMSSIKPFIDAAPKLPIPKPHKWQSIVHLHGIIDEEIYPNGENLIFTSGDFGSAYLTERWASTFITELFNHFTVLFVGYSINDPVIRYMTDAIAAERRIGYPRFKQPYVMAHAQPSKIEKETINWRAKGVEPILYSGRHNNLHETLRAWAAYIRDGLSAKARIIRTYAPKKPLPPYEHDENVLRVIDILKEKTKLNHYDVLGFPAQIFRDIKDPVTPIEWLPVIHEHGLLNIAENQDKLNPVNKLPLVSNLLAPNKITSNFWGWLIHHLEDDRLVNWIIEQGPYLHPLLKQLIRQNLKSGRKPKEPYSTFWQIVTSEHLISESLSKGYDEVPVLGATDNELFLSTITDLLKPGFKLRKALTWEGDTRPLEARKPYDAEVIIGLSTYAYQEWKKIEGYPQRFINLLLPVTQALNQAIKFWELIGVNYDRSHWDLPSILPHEQNNRSTSWVILIELCRDLWGEAWNTNKPLAMSVLELWKSLAYPVFRRLVLHAYTYESVVQPDVALYYLLENDGCWLWVSDTRREKFRLLECIGTKLSAKGVGKLFQYVLAGPPSKLYVGNLDNLQPHYFFELGIWLLLAKLKSFGYELNEAAESRLTELCKKYPDWKLDGEHDEFSNWTKSGHSFETDITMDALFILPVPRLVEQLLEENHWYNHGRIDEFRKGCNKYSQTAIEILNYLKQQCIWDKTLWHSALVGLAESENPSWLPVADILQEADQSLFSSDHAWAIAWWTRKAAKNIQAHSENEKYFWMIANKLIDGANPIQIDKNKDIIDKAINHPIGILTEALIERFAQCKLKAKEGIPQPYYLNYINKIIAGRDNSLLLGQAILASRLSYFYIIDPIWTRTQLLPKFDWENSQTAILMWQGYLWEPKIPIDLAIELKELLIIALKKLEGNSYSTTQLHCLFAFICLNYPDLYTLEDQHQALISIGQTGLSNIAKFLYQSICQDKANRENYWKNRLKPFIHIWPKTGSLNNSNTAVYLILMSIQLNESFSEALKSIEHLIMPLKDTYLLLQQLAEKELVDNKPKEIFNLLCKVFSKDQWWKKDLLQHIVDRLLLAEPELENDPRLKAIKDYLLQQSF